MKYSFFGSPKPTLTVMVQANSPQRIIELIDKSSPEGAEAFGMQFEQMDPEFKTKEVYKELFSYTKDKLIYATNYRGGKNEGKSDEVLAKEIIEIAECGADLCDIMGDYFDRQPDEMAKNEDAVKKQIDLITEIHKRGAKVLMSSHVYKYIPAQRVLEIALEQQRRGADICKIVTGASNYEEELENLKIINLLKENLNVPFLFLCTGECSILRRIGGKLGCCMYLCVYEHDKLATAAQPLLKDIKVLRDLI